MENVSLSGVAIHNDLLVVSVDRLTNQGLSNKYVKNNISANKGKWASIVDPTDKRKRWIIYKTINETTRKKFNLPEPGELTKLYLETEKIQELKERRITTSLREQTIDCIFNDALDKGYLAYMEQYSNVFPKIQIEKIRNASQFHAVLFTILRLTERDNKDRYKQKEIIDSLIRLNLDKRWKGIFSKEKLSKKLKQFKEEPSRAIVHGRQGKLFNRKVLNAFTKAKIEQYMSMPAIYSAETITMLVDMEIRRVNKDMSLKLKEISIPYVKRYMRMPEVRNSLLYYRKNIQWRKEVQSFMRRKGAMYAGDCYQGDGTRIQIISWNKAGTKPIRTNIFVFLDVYSGKITGFDLAENEDRYNLLDALEMAIALEGFSPFEVVLDNASSTKTDEFKEIKRKFESKGVLIRYAKVGNPQDKSNVERFNRTFQNKFQRLIDGFVGGGITSKVENERIDQDYLDTVKKVNGYYQYNEMQKIIAELIAIYNNTPIKNGKSPNQLFRESEKPNVKKLRPEEVAMMFWHYTVVTVRNQEIEITIQHNRYHYDISYHKDILKISGTKVRVYYDRSQLEVVHVFDLEDNYLGEIKQKTKIWNAAANRVENEDLEIIKQSSHKKKLSRIIDERSKKVMKEGVELVGNEIMYETINPRTAAKLVIQNTESEFFISHYGQKKGIDFGSLQDREPVKIETPYNTRDEGEPKNINVYTSEGTNEVVTDDYFKNDRELIED